MASLLDRYRAVSARIGQSAAAPIVLLAGVGLAHRLFLFAWYFDDISLMVRNNPDWLTWQYLTIPALRDHLADSLLYLQQTPPLPQLLLGACLKVFSWPAQVSYILILANGLISIIAAILLYRLGARFTRTKALSLDPRNPMIQMGQAAAYYQLGRDQEARAACEKVLLLKPNDPSAKELLKRIAIGGPR